MSAVFFLFGAALLGIGLVRRVLAGTLNRPEQMAWGIVIGWSAATAIGYAVARLFGGLNFRAALILVGLVWAATIICWRPAILKWLRPGNRRLGFNWDRSLLPLVIVLCLFAPIYLHLFGTHMLELRPDGGLYSGGESTSYDMAFHAAVTNAFVYGANFPAVYPPLPPAPLTYPFLPDFLTALLVVSGLDLHTALVATGVPLCLALTAIFYFLAFRFLELTKLNPERLGWMAAIATLLCLFNGGFGFVYFFQDWRASGANLWTFLSGINLNYTHIAARSLVWPNIITDMLLPQRTSIFGLSLGFIVLGCLAIAWQRTDGARPSDGRALAFGGIIAGLLPYFHVHSYAAVGFVGGFLFLLRPRKVWLAFLVPAVLLAFPRWLELGGHATGAGFIRFQPGWRGQDEANWLQFWVRNIGLPAVLMIPAWLMVPRAMKLWYLSFVVLLIVALLVVFSPNDYDNLKVMAYWYAFTCVVIAAGFARLSKSRAGLACVIGCVLISTLSGALAVVSEWRARNRLFAPGEIAAAEFVKAHTAPHSLFLTAPNLLQPVLSLAGRPVVRGPTAWLWSHGYPFAEREADVRAIYAGRDDALDLLSYYRVDYVYLGPNEAAELRANKEFFDANFPVVYRDSDIAIYGARKPGPTNAARLDEYPPREYGARIDRDPAGFLTEFPEVAFRLWRLRKVAFGGTPRYGEFIRDLRQLGHGLYPGAVGWQRVLEANTRALCDEWVEHSGLKERSDGQFMDAIVANAGLTFTERSAWAANLASGRETRAALLRRVGSDRRLYRRDYKEAWLLCHYFAYLRRNPDESPDHDLSGYNFWLRQLARTNDLRGLTRAFLESDEYKQQTR